METNELKGEIASLKVKMVKCEEKKNDLKSRFRSNLCILSIAMGNSIISFFRSFPLELCKWCLSPKHPAEIKLDKMENLQNPHTFFQNQEILLLTSNNITADGLFSEQAVQNKAPSQQNFVRGH